jgi:drug/metabolite transporter (DMT)-like permease
LPFVLAVALGLQLTSAGRAAAIAPTLMPVFAGAFAWIFLKEKQGRARWCGYLAIIIGLVFMVAGGVSAHGGMNPMGLIALMTAAAMWAVYTLLFRRSALTPVQAAALICFWSAILFLPIYIFGGLSRLAMASPSEIGLQAVYQGVLMSGVAIVSSIALSRFWPICGHSHHRPDSGRCFAGRHSRTWRAAVWWRVRCTCRRCWRRALGSTSCP